MRNDHSSDIKDFIAGLKIVIRNSWPTQEEFSKGVTSKVNLSNILRGTSGTSLNMRKALAKKAGMTIDEITQLGKRTWVNVESMETLAAISPQPVKEEEFSGGSATELTNKASGLTLDFQSELTKYARSMTTMLASTVAERDKLIYLLAQEQTIVNSLPMAIKVVNREMQVVYTNRAMMEQFQVTPGDRCDQICCDFCNLVECAVKRVFERSSLVQHLVRHEDVWYVLTAYPITDTSWTISRAIVMLTPASPLMQLLVENGWTPPAEG